MKFARYLQETQTPEWKKAYIDYRGLKKRITAIKKAQQTGSMILSDEDEVEIPQDSPSSVVRRETSATPSHRRRLGDYGSTGTTPPLLPLSDSQLPSLALALPPSATHPIAHNDLVHTSNTVSSASHTSIGRPHAPRRAQTDNHADIGEKLTQRRSRSTTATPAASTDHSHQSDHAQSGFFANIRRRPSWRTQNGSGGAPQNLPLFAILPSLPTVQKKFFEALDRELEKVESFYRARESEAIVKSSALKEQLRELQEHRHAFHQARDSDSKWTTLPLARVVVERVAALSLPIGGSSERPRQIVQSVKSKVVNLNGKEPVNGGPPEQEEARFDPDEYIHAKHGLKRAILEYYRGLELLNNYRVLNLTGFRKALKKFEKVAGVTVQNSYMQEKVEPCAFALGVTIEKMTKEIEDLYAARFERGDKKRARTRLRATAKQKSHHFSTFRTGIYIGTALPAFISGIYESFQPDTRDEIPWGPLLLTYATLLIPILFSLLVGLNVLVWSRSRINYGFIFDLDVRTQLDSREYFELPSFLLCTLCYAFWLSFTRLGANTILPTTWPIAWIIFALVVMINPTPILFPKSRWWLIRSVSKLLTSGTRPVEFVDFWMGDQFCSLIFTLANLYFVGCAYSEGWQDALHQCSTSGRWGVPFTLSALPLLVRTVQSIKRYIDSGLITHLINGGKYFSSIVYYLVYFIWRHQNLPHNYLLVLLCVFATNYSIYTTAWDVLMDWSFFKRPAQYPLLRSELLYPKIPVYYFAIVTNILIRFIWIIYIPTRGPNFTVRTFIAGFLEMLRRFQWNFFRLENEHIGNTDQYRVTREVPLPYSFDDVDNESDGGDEDDNENFNRNSSWSRRRSVRMAPFSGVHDRDESQTEREEDR